MANPLSLNPENRFDWRWAGFGLLLSTLLGLALFVIPVHYIIGLLVGAAIVGYLALSPDKLFYLVIFTIPFSERIHALPLSFAPNDIFFFFSVFVCLCHAMIRGQRVNLRTGLDGWMLTLTLLFGLAGFFSAAGTSGVLGFLKFLQSIFIYYMAVYLIRTRQVSRAAVLRAILAGFLFQAGLGIFQSFTGIGAEFQSNRGYLGYLGLGSSHVWHGHGMTFHFNSLGSFLSSALLIFLPVYLYCVRRKKWVFFLGGILFLGLITTYSRGSLLALGAGITFLLAAIQPTFKRSLMFVAVFLLGFVLPAVWYFSNTSYVETLSYSDRLRIWQVPLMAITSSDKAFWLGSGLNSYAAVAWQYIPANVPHEAYRFWFAHNFYLLTMLELGLIGSFILFGFLAYLCVDAWRKFKRSRGLQRTLSLSLGMSVFAIFFISIFDHGFAAPPQFKMLLFLLLGIIYVNHQPASPKIQTWQ